MKLFTLPNFITLGNLFFGCIGIIFVFESNFEYASYCIFVALVLDFFDGFAARLLKISSEIGKQLDSLADVVTFGVLPSLLIYKYLEKFDGSNIKYLAFILALFSALRLAKFNIDTRQSDSFIGLPTPANAVLVATFPFLIKTAFWSELITNPMFLLGYVALFSYFLIMELPLFALKFKNFSWKENQIKFIFIILSVFLLLILKISAIPLIILLYLTVSGVKHYLKN